MYFLIESLLLSLDTGSSVRIAFNSFSNDFEVFDRLESTVTVVFSKFLLLSRNKKISLSFCPHDF